MRKEKFLRKKSMLYPFSWRNLCFTYKSLFENKRDFLAKKEVESIILCPIQSRLPGNYSRLINGDHAAVKGN